MGTKSEAESEGKADPVASEGSDDVSEADKHGDANETDIQPDETTNSTSDSATGEENNNIGETTPEVSDPGLDEKESQAPAQPNQEQPIDTESSNADELSEQASSEAEKQPLLKETAV